MKSEVLLATSMTWAASAVPTGPGETFAAPLVSTLPKVFQRPVAVTQRLWLGSSQAIQCLTLGAGTGMMGSHASCCPHSIAGHGLLGAVLGTRVFHGDVHHSGVLWRFVSRSPQHVRLGDSAHLCRDTAHAELCAVL